MFFNRLSYGDPVQLLNGWPDRNSNYHELFDACEWEEAKFNIWVSILTNPSDRAGYDTKSIFKRSLTGLNSEFSFSYTSCLTEAKEPSLPYYLPITGGRIIGFIPFPRVLVLCEMQSASFRIWTRIAVSIYYDDNHYTKDSKNGTWYRLA